MEQTVARTGNRVSSGTRSRAIVVGAGFGGIASALRLTAKGYRVTVIDRAPMLGGRAQVFEKDGFKHDAGPTVITAPFLIEELFELFGKKSSDYFTLRSLTPWYRFYFDEDGSTFDYGGTLEETLAAAGVTVWPMVEFEADDALAAAATAAARDPRVERVIICTPDKDLAQCVSGTRIVQLNRRTRITFDEGGVVRKFGVRPASIPDYLALVGDSADGYPGLPGWGAKSAAAVLAKFGRIEAIPKAMR